MSSAYRAHRLIFQRFSAAQFEKAFKQIRKASTLPFGAAVKQRLTDGLYKAQKNILVFAVDADLTLFRRYSDSTAQDNILYHQLGKETLVGLRKVLGDPDAVKTFVPDGDIDPDSQRAYTFYCETILGEGFRLPHLWSESGRFRDFKTRNPMAVMLLQKVFDNYVGNLIECLQRVSADITALQACFLGGKTIKRIAKITATGSDSQRGGKQVLFLDLETDEQVITRVVYKPSDIEIDYLLIGRNTGAINDFLAAHHDDPGYPRPNQSLFELVNESLANTTIEDPDASRPLSTYVVLPRNPGSRFSPQETAPPIRDSYGYLEFLSYAPEPPRPPTSPGDTLIDVFTSHPDVAQPPAPRDWIVDKPTDAAACMRNWGRISILTGLMLMRDLHHENRRLRNANPTLIDLEMTGTGVFKSASESGLFYSIRQAAHSTRGEQLVEFTDGIAGPIGRLHGAGIPAWGLDQLYLSADGERQAQLCRFDSPDASADISRGMFDILDVLTAPALKAWITRVGMGQVIVRYLSLESFGEVIEGALKELMDIHQPAPSAEAAMQKYWDDRLQSMRRSQITEWVNLFFDPSRRTFLFETPEGIGRDLMNLDLPRFYRRMNSRTLLTSSGDALPFSKNYYDLDVLFPDTDKIAGMAKAEVAKEMQFDRFLETTGMTDLSTAIDQRLGLDEADKQAQVEKDIRECGIAPPAMPADLFVQGH